MQQTSLEIFKQKYAFGEEKVPEDSFNRIAYALAKQESVEPTFSERMFTSSKKGILENTEVEDLSLHQTYWYYQFLEALNNGAIPAGRISSNIGAESSKPNTSLINCTVSRTPIDSVEGIATMLKEAMLTLAKGCGIGYCCSSLRPKGAFVNGVGAETSGSLSFMEIFDTMCKTIASAGGRRGAQMLTMHCWHPDIYEFVTKKHEVGKFRQFNLSVLVTDEFMEAVRNDKDWDLYFPLHTKESLALDNTIYVPDFPFTSDDYRYDQAQSKPVVVCKVYKTVKARELWDLIMQSTYDYAEPGIIFVDLYNKANPLNCAETIVATNPCLHPDSLIETVNGRVKIADIVEPTMVYTMLPDGSLGIKQASASFISAKQVKTLKISTRNGKSLRVTPNHKVKVHETLVGGDGWRKAEDLKIGDRIVQLCRARRGAAYSGVKLTTEDNRAYKMEHIMIANAVYGVSDKEDVHHIDGDTYNNCIDNLEVMTHAEHSRHTALCDNPQVHQQTCSITGKYISTGISAKRIIPMPENLRSNMKNNFSSAIVSIEEELEEVDVYDLTVEGTHNFIADFCVVHNCGEQGLPEFGSCLLGSVILSKFVRNAFKQAYEEPSFTNPDGYTGIGATFDWETFDKTVRTFVRMLDNVVELHGLALPEQAHEILHKRRHGMGYTGLGTTLNLLGMQYGSPEAVEFCEEVTKRLAVINLEEGFALAKEKGKAPIFEDKSILKAWVSSEFVQQVIGESDTVASWMLDEHGSRFTHATSIAPTGTISLAFGNNCSNGIEPSFAHSYFRNVIIPNKKTKKRVEVLSEEALLWRELHGDTQYPEWFVTTQDITPESHIAMQAAAQKWIDSSISKTINCPSDISFEDFKDIYLNAYDAGLKGVTTYRPSSGFTAVLQTSEHLETIYEFTLEDGTTVKAKANETIWYDGEEHEVENLFCALNEGYYGKL